MKRKSMNKTAKPNTTENTSKRTYGNSRKHKSGSRRRKENNYERDSGETVGSSTNDISWYEQTPELLRDAASIPFSYALGTRLDYQFDVTDGTITLSSSPVTIPGIMAFRVVPSMGDTLSYDTDEVDVNSPLNIASNAVYSFVRHANSGSKNYDAPNLMMYCMSLAQIYSYLNFLQRIYGTAQLYSHSNRYLPRAIIEAQNVDFDDLIANLANFRYGVNSLIYKAASFACPADMTYFRRLAFLFSGIYSEGETPKSQLYMYVPEGFLKLEEAGSAPGWKLRYTQFYGSASGGGKFKVSQLIKYGTDLLNPLVQSEDINIMSGDILKAYGSNILKLQTLPEVFTILPVTDLVVLEQMQNAIVIPNLNGINAKTSGSLHVEVSEVPDKNAIYSAVYIDNVDQISGANKLLPMVSGALLQNPVLTTILTSPTAADVMERTRFMYEVTFTDGDMGRSQEYLTGSDFVDGISMWTVNPSTGAPTETPFNQCYRTVDTTAFTKLAMASKFKFYPTAAIITNTGNSYTLDSIFAGYDNYTQLSSSDVGRINEAAKLALFRVPSIAKF